MREFIETFFGSPLWLRIGWTILHSLWLITLFAVTTAFILSLVRKHSAQLRYLCATTSLCVMALAVAVTFWAIPLPRQDLTSTTQEDPRDQIEHQPPALIADSSSTITDRPPPDRTPN